MYRDVSLKTDKIFPKYNITYFEVFRVSRHGNTFRQVQVIFNGHSPACKGLFLQSPSRMRLIELSVSVRNVSDVFPHGIPGVFATCGPEKGPV